MRKVRIRKDKKKPIRKDKFTKLILLYVYIVHSLNTGGQLSKGTYESKYNL